MHAKPARRNANEYDFLRHSVTPFKTLVMLSIYIDTERIKVEAKMS